MGQEQRVAPNTVPYAWFPLSLALSCLGGVLLNADTEEEYCAASRPRPVIAHSAKAQDEGDYLWLPPCQYGSRAEGLRPPPVVTVVNTSTRLRSIRWANSSVAHFGVMAIW